MERSGRTEVRKLGQQPIAVFTYDNFEYTEVKRSERLGDKKNFVSITTALVTQGRLIPSGGLIQSMWNPKIRLDPQIFWNYMTRNLVFEQVSPPHITRKEGEKSGTYVRTLRQDGDEG